MNGNQDHFSVVVISTEFENLMNTRFVWGGDYQRTMPETYGTILPDGTGGRAPKSYRRDGVDNDRDGEVDEWDELFVTNEFVDQPSPSQK